MTTAIVPLSRSERAAQVISEIFGPAPLLTLAFVEAGIRVGMLAGWWSLLPIFGVAILPYAAMIWLAHRGRVSDRFVGERSQRLPVLLAVLGSVIAVIAILLVVAAPWPVTSLTIASALGLVVVMTVNARWKLSIHMAIAAFVCLYQFTILPAGAAAATLVILPLLGWARIAARAHTSAQVVAGALAGAAVFLAFLVIR